MKKDKIKQINILAIIFLSDLFILFLFPLGDKVFSIVRTHAYAYAYFLPRGLKIDDVSRLNPAESVPILRYYDISLKKASGSGIERPVFIEQMESLKEQ